MHVVFNIALCQPFLYPIVYARGLPRGKGLSVAVLIHDDHNHEVVVVITAHHMNSRPFCHSG